MLDPREKSVRAPKKNLKQIKLGDLWAIKNKIAARALKLLTAQSDGIVHMYARFSVLCDQNINFTTFKWAHKNNHKTNINVFSFYLLWNYAFSRPCGRFNTLTPFSIIVSMMLLVYCYQPCAWFACGSESKFALRLGAHREEFSRLILNAFGVSRDHES